MPTLEVDHTGFICVAVVIFVVMLGMSWTIYSQSCRLAFMRQRKAELDSHWVTEEALGTPSPALDKKLGMELPAIASTKTDDLAVSKPVYVPMQRPDQEYRPCFSSHDSSESSPSDWEFALVLPSNAQSSPLELYYRAMISPQASVIGLVHHRIDHERNVVRIRLTQSKEKQIEASKKCQDSRGFICCKLGAGGPYPYPSDTWIHVRE